MPSLYKKKQKPMPNYLPTEDEIKWSNHCIRNNIRISPEAIENDSNHWRISITLGAYKKGEKSNISPSIYCRKTVWAEYYKMCKYYYGKHTR